MTFRAADPKKYLCTPKKPLDKTDKTGGLGGSVSFVKPNPKKSAAKKTKQPRLFPRTVLEPIAATDALPFDALLTHYRCSCGNAVSTGVCLESVVCTRCGASMSQAAVTPVLSLGAD